jgi:succinoglycan biosynthesis transport protein ExoP
MSEFLQFLRLLQRNKITLILVPLITVIITYFLVRRLPDTFVSRARIATGLGRQDRPGDYESQR